MKHTTFALTAFMAAFLLLSGCATGLTVQVNAIADTDLKPTGMHYVLLNGNAEGREDDLFFREFSAYFTRVLDNKGYQQVKTRDQADIEIFFRYNVSDGRSGIHTFTRPIYESIGGNTIRFSETKTDAAGTTTTTGTVHIPVSYQYVGTAVESHSYTVFTSSIALEAYVVMPKPGTPPILWKTLISSTSNSNDLRAIMPMMAVAAEPYLGSNSGKQQTIHIKFDNPKLIAIRKAAAKK